MILLIDGVRREFDLAEISPRLADADDAARAHFEISPSGYGIRWPEVDEDLSVDGLLRHAARRAVA
jgi:hypothetical protein